MTLTHIDKSQNPDPLYMYSCDAMVAATKHLAGTHSSSNLRHGRRTSGSTSTNFFRKKTDVKKSRAAVMKKKLRTPTGQGTKMSQTARTEETTVFVKIHPNNVRNFASWWRTCRTVAVCTVGTRCATEKKLRADKVNFVHKQPTTAPKCRTLHAWKRRRCKNSALQNCAKLCVVVEDVRN